jgi:hypothetical protein
VGAIVLVGDHWWGVDAVHCASATIKLAGWARVLVQHWKEWTHATWVWLFGWPGIHLPPDWTPVLSFLLFGSLLTIGQAVNFHNTIKRHPIADKYQGKSCAGIFMAWSPSRHFNAG